MSNKKVVIIRGLPGSGKTTIALKSFANRGYVHCEADHFFHNDGVYTFDSSKLTDAHEYCLNKAINALNKKQKVVISNTFTRKWEIQELLQKLPVDPVKDVEVLVATGGTGSVNNVPEYAIMKMKQRWQPWHNERYVFLDPVTRAKLIRAINP